MSKDVKRGALLVAAALTVGAAGAAWRLLGEPPEVWKPSLGSVIAAVALWLAYRAGRVR